MKRTLLLPLFVALTACATDEPADVDDFGTTGSDVGSDVRTTPNDSGGGTPDMSVRDMGSTPDMSSVDFGRPDLSDLGTADMAEPDMTEPDMAQQPPGETCETATDATAGGTFVGDTTDGVDDYDAELTADGCPSGGASGPDHVYSLSPAVETAYLIRVEPEGNYDPFLYVKADCAASACVDGTVLNGPGTAESLRVTVPAGVTYFVIVDGELLSEGAYTLMITGS